LKIRWIINARLFRPLKEHQRQSVLGILFLHFKQQKKNQKHSLKLKELSRQNEEEDDLGSGFASELAAFDDEEESNIHVHHEIGK
jgi:hypothetical protein